MGAVAAQDISIASELDFESCYREHWRQVYRMAMRYAGGRASWAEDLTHDVFIKLLEHMESIENREQIGGWLYRVTANLAISRLRRDRSWLGKMRSYSHEPRRESKAADELFEHHRDAARALETLQTLPPREQLVVTMKLLDGKSQREIAQILDLSQGYVSKLLHRGLERVRRADWEVSDG